MRNIIIIALLAYLVYEFFLKGDRVGTTLPPTKDGLYKSLAPNISDPQAQANLKDAIDEADESEIQDLVEFVKKPQNPINKNNAEIIFSKYQVFNK